MAIEKTNSNANVKIEIANCDPQLRNFLNCILTIFTDPALAPFATNIRKRQYFIAMRDDGTPMFEDQDSLGGFKNIMPPPLS